MSTSPAAHRHKPQPLRHQESPRAWPEGGTGKWEAPARGYGIHQAQMRRMRLIHAGLLPTASEHQTVRPTWLRPHCQVLHEDRRNVEVSRPPRESAARGHPWDWPAMCHHLQREAFGPVLPAQVRTQRSTGSRAPHPSSSTSGCPLSAGTPMR